MPEAPRTRPSIGSALRADWREIGGLGRFSLVGIGIAAIITVILGFSITSTVRNQLLSARAALIEAAVADEELVREADEWKDSADARSNHVWEKHRGATT